MYSKRKCIRAFLMLDVSHHESTAAWIDKIDGWHSF